MPIYEQTYRRYEARAPLRTLRFWPITREALRLILARRAFLGLLLVAWGQFLFRVIQIYVVTRLPEAGRVLPIDGRMFGRPRWAGATELALRGGIGDGHEDLHHRRETGLVQAIRARIGTFTLPAGRIQRRVRSARAVSVLRPPVSA